MPDFLELTITANAQQRELAVALLADFGFDIFEEKLDDGEESVKGVGVTA